MKATGIVRRLDDLGRLVIPKEIRKIYKLKEGDSIEFFVNEDSEIVLKKFSVLSDETESITRMCQTLQEVTEHPVLFVEDDQILCVGQAKLDEWRSQSLSVEFQECVKAYHVRPFDQVRLFAAKPETFKGTIFPVAVYGDRLGAFVVVEEDTPLQPPHLDIAQAFSRLLIRNHEH